MMNARIESTSWLSMLLALTVCACSSDPGADFVGGWHYEGGIASCEQATLRSDQSVLQGASFPLRGIAVEFRATPSGLEFRGGPACHLLLEVDKEGRRAFAQPGQSCKRRIGQTSVDSQIAAFTVVMRSEFEALNQSDGVATLDINGTEVDCARSRFQDALLVRDTNGAVPYAE